MDLYEAIEIVDEWVRSFEESDEWDTGLMQAIKICLEAARDKAGV